MARDLTVILEDRPGTLADMAEALGKAGINIDGICGLPSEGKGVFHLLVEDAAGARSALEGVSIEVGAEREVVVIEVDDRPGALGDIARKIANEGVNVDLTYMATSTRLVVGTNDLEKTRAAL